MEQIKTPPTSKAYRDNFDKVFKNVRLEPSTIKLDENGKVVVLIKTLDGDIYLGEK